LVLVATYGLAVEHELEAEGTVEVFLPNGNSDALVDEYRRPTAMVSSRFSMEMPASKTAPSPSPTARK
jgi:hypothetical protein